MLVITSTVHAIGIKSCFEHMFIMFSFGVLYLVNMKFGSPAFNVFQKIAQ